MTMDTLLAVVSLGWGILLLPLGWLWSQSKGNHERTTRIAKELHQKIDAHVKDFTSFQVDAARDYVTEEKINGKIAKSEANVLTAVEVINKKVDHIETKVDKLLQMRS